MNHPLARALRGAGINTIDVASRLQVDPKTVQRWLTGRMPYPRHRAALARLTGWAERDLWPHAARPADHEANATDEIIAVYPHRSAVPVDAWRHLFEHAETEIGILVYSGLSLAEDVAALRVLRDKVRDRVRVRILLGDPDGEHIARRGADEQIGAMMSARIRNALLLYAPLAGEPGVELRLHDTVLYNSIYRSDDLMLINPHAHGCPASHAPVLHLRGAGQDGMVVHLRGVLRAGVGECAPGRTRRGCTRTHNAGSSAHRPTWLPPGPAPFLFAGTGPVTSGDTFRSGGGTACPAALSPDRASSGTR